MDDNLRNREFLGQGVAFPLQYDPRGGIALSKGERDIAQAIHIILATRPGERKMRPEFGCRVYELIFEPRSSASTQSLLIMYVRDALARWEPRIDVEDVRVQDDPENDGAVITEIAYTIKDTHDQRSIVHPFYIGTEEEAPRE